MIKDTDDFKLVNESFPHVGKSLDLTWGSREFLNYTNRLFFDTRDGKRQGFPLPVLKALHKLCELHDQEFPEYVRVDEDEPPFTFGQKRY